jgi:hypothetical protein
MVKHRCNILVRPAYILINQSARYIQVKQSLLLILVLLLAVFINPPACNANAAAPPSIIIIVASAPDDLVISIEPGDIQAHRTDKVLESYFSFYSYDLKSANYNLKITAGGRTFEVALNAPLQFNNIFTLDLEKQIVTPGKSFTRSFNLTSLRIILTLIIEALVFFLFGYRKKRSWFIFLIVNLVTQGALNIWLSVSTTPMQSYLIFSLVFGEILVFIVEIGAFLVFIKEFRSLVSLYVIVANAASLFLGGVLITHLPV